MSANRHRGEIEAELDGRHFKLCLTLGALAELESAYRAEDLTQLVGRFSTGKLAAADLIRLIGAGDIARAFGLKGEIALIGYLFDEALAARGPALIEGFLSSSRAAKRLLAEDPTQRIHQVAAMAGFDDQRYFSKVFRRAAGCTPQQYAASIPRKEVPSP